MRTHGTLVKWNDEQGFGFVSLASGRGEVFVHVSAFPRDGTRPHVGEMISFELQAGADGKRKAVRVQRPGSRQSASARMRSTRHGAGAEKRGVFRPLVIAASLVAMVAVGYTRWVSPRIQESEPLVVASTAKLQPAEEVFQCDGRVHCSEMRSCAEARYFLKNCPGTRMDGNQDGEPCEQQLCN